MRFIADLHIHSHYSISTSPQLTPEHLDAWARVKGITVVGTGDFTHPGWLAELKEKLAPAEQGLFRLKEEYRLAGGASGGLPPELPPDLAAPPALAGQGAGTRFLLSAEISNIYRKAGRVRKVHNLILAPDFQSAEKIQARLARLANISSDGRPIIGLDSRDLLEIALEASPGIFFIPAHIWTPWFSALGARSGFDSIAECYADLAGHIRAVETGLSSDPPMNWLCSSLDRYTLVSNSDAHSPEKLGREANLFDTDLSYPAIVAALSETGSIRSRDGENAGTAAGQAGFLGTIEFFPQEGKYHFDGHRKCGVRWDPLETLRHGGICPVCGRAVTVGVLSRVAQLADRGTLPAAGSRPAFHSLIPLKEILSELAGVGPQSKKIARSYRALVGKAGSELALLLDLPVPQIGAGGNELLAEAIRRMRSGQVLIEPGYDGQYGRVRLFTPGERKRFGPQELLFLEPEGESRSPAPRHALLSFDLQAYRRLSEEGLSAAAHLPPSTRSGAREKQLRPAAERPLAALGLLADLNPEQRRAVTHRTGPALILAGPGTGKTRTLTARIAYLIEKRGVLPEHILAVTFTNKAAAQMQERLAELLGGLLVGGATSEPPGGCARICTFHALGLSILKQHFRRLDRTEGFSLGDEEDRTAVLRSLSVPAQRASSFGERISALKRELKTAAQIDDLELRELFVRYEQQLRRLDLFDLDDLIYQPVQLLSSDPQLAGEYRRSLPWLLVDEYQDVNLAQYRLIRLLASGPEANLFVIGDPHQAIYGFRGADVRFIEQFVRDWPEATLYDLRRSYRCSDTILRASAQVLSGRGSEGRLRGSEEGVRIRITENRSDRSEAEQVARTIEAMMGGLRFFSLDSEISEGSSSAGIGSLADFAVLCRIGRQMGALEKAFRDHSVPYQRIGELPFFRQEPAKSAVDIIRALAGENPLLEQTLLARRRISSEQLSSLKDRAREGGPIAELVAAVMDIEPVRIDSDELRRRLLELAAAYGEDLAGFVEFLLLGGGADTFQPESERVALMTLHAAKGLEFPCVFIVGCEDGLLPYSLFAGQASDPGEERRLFYVGMTRAKRFLFLSYAARRYLFGREYRLAKSPFLAPIEEKLIETRRAEIPPSGRGKTGADAQLRLF
jgi:DNA helicase-2/ATP-dependent DNA helicase PcrA